MRTSLQNVKAIQMAFYIIMNWNISYAFISSLSILKPHTSRIETLNKAVRAFQIFETSDGMDISKRETLTKCLEVCVISYNLCSSQNQTLLIQACHLLISPKRLAAHIKTLPLEVPKRLPLHEFLFLIPACVDMPDLSLPGAQIVWGKTRIQNLRDAYNFLDEQYEEEAMVSESSLVESGARIHRRGRVKPISSFMKSYKSGDALLKSVQRLHDTNEAELSLEELQAQSMSQLV